MAERRRVLRIDLSGAITPFARTGERSDGWQWPVLSLDSHEVPTFAIADGYRKVTRPRVGVTDLRGRKCPFSATNCGAEKAQPVEGPGEGGHRATSMRMSVRVGDVFRIPNSGVARHGSLCHAI